MASGKIFHKIRTPVVVVLGSTGTGKSKLAIDIACKFNGEIISADAMQVYKGLDIITNKVTNKEQLQCKHHMIGLVSPTHTNCSVVEFQRAALQIIEKLQSNNKLPVIVGGTNYYIESILWNTLLTERGVKSDLAGSDGSDTGPESGDEAATLSSVDSSDAYQISPHERSPGGSRDLYRAHTTEHLHERLRAVDEASALRIHPRNRRKIIRALEVYDTHSVTATSLYHDQHSVPEAISGDLRFPHPCVLYLQSDQAILDKRLDTRVDSMIEQGLVEELSNFHQDYHRVRVNTPGCHLYTEGIFQSIGFKEFHQFLIMSLEERATVQGKQLFDKCVVEMKRATRRYCRYQQRWVNKRFLTHRGRDVPLVYSLDVSDPDQWPSAVSQPARAIIQSYLQGEVSPAVPLPFRDDYTNRHVHNVCEVCDGQVFVTHHDWTVHMSSRRHKKRLQKLRRRENMPHIEHTETTPVLEETVKT